MTEDRPVGSPESNLPADGSPAGVSREGWAAVNRPIFWVASSAIFMINAVLSFVQGHWGLAALETATGTLALVAAASVAESRRRPPSVRRNSMADMTNPHDTRQAERSRSQPRLGQSALPPDDVKR
jgi:hypothetical protein